MVATLRWRNIIWLSILIFAGILSAGAAEFTKTERFASVRFSYVELLILVKSVQTYVRDTNASFSSQTSKDHWDTRTRIPTEELMVEDDSIKVSVTGDFSQLLAENIPPVANSVYYSYRLSGAPISRAHWSY